MTTLAAPPRPKPHGTTAPRPAPPPLVLSSAETAECACPEFCERDHDRD
jgi:hypothetical protein